MKISPTVKVVLESPDGNAVFTFRKPRLNDHLKVDDVPEGVSKEEKLRLALSRVFERLISVDGLFHEDGTPVTKDEIANLDLDPATIFAIVEGYNHAVNGTKPDEKNGSASA